MQSVPRQADKPEVIVDDDDEEDGGVSVPSAVRTDDENSDISRHSDEEEEEEEEEEDEDSESEDSEDSDSDSDDSEPEGSETASLLYARPLSGYGSFKCPIEGCNKAYASLRALVDHISAHTEELICGIDGCQQKCATKIGLKLHQKIHSPMTEEFICGIDGCQKRYQTEAGLATHRRKSHNFKCPVDGCERSFATPEALEQHMINDHADN